MSVVALVPAAGRGERLGAGVPKALVSVRGEPLLVHAVRGLLAAGCVHSVVVAAPVSDVDTMTRVLAFAGSHARVVPGGSSRTQSVRLALGAAPPDTTVVLVHDAARAFTPAELVKAVVARVDGGADAVIPVLPVADTIKRVDAAGRVAATPDRADLRVVQTPQGFRAEVLRRAYDAYPDATTDDAGLVERLGVPVDTIPGHPYAMKITTPFDLAVAEAILR
ncbi:MAG TPA: 2-C-methyl-D-erythritol 4-phosphate cytidylyltransferase [Actinophytocola sp.]|uniref:2-C-methyl-D-erythritol 4-phosphate cytidylyltransferase n=1 Tax=Actinophytocola sp. TaxID=1872138 RepID=UPI002DBD1A7A|nr:2-C-methyl-D-erythritol 4-phosphate cytidylyltransferase [Actinophytocola sp.]HEU5471798.1 2-C-methyl-D-erythritol 4-phosphate cytidylyltransferase [Actinophytocola sp.]